MGWLSPYLGSDPYMLRIVNEKPTLNSIIIDTNGKLGVLEFDFIKIAFANIAFIFALFTSSLLVAVAAGFLAGKATKYHESIDALAKAHGFESSEQLVNAGIKTTAQFFIDLFNNASSALFPKK